MTDIIVDLTDRPFMSAEEELMQTLGWGSIVNLWRVYEAVEELEAHAEVKRYLYGFKLTARLRRFVEEKRGREATIKHELVTKDGRLLIEIPKGLYPLCLAPFYITWPYAKVAWSVYVKETQK